MEWDRLKEYAPMQIGMLCELGESFSYQLDKAMNKTSKIRKEEINEYLQLFSDYERLRLSFMMAVKLNPSLLRTIEVFPVILPAKKEEDDEDKKEIKLPQAPYLERLELDLQNKAKAINELIIRMQIDKYIDIEILFHLTGFEAYVYDVLSITYREFERGISISKKMDFLLIRTLREQINSCISWVMSNLEDCAGWYFEVCHEFNEEERYYCLSLFANSLVAISVSEKINKMISEKIKNLNNLYKIFKIIINKQEMVRKKERAVISPVFYNIKLGYVSSKNMSFEYIKSKIDIANSPPFYDVLFIEKSTSYL